MSIAILPARLANQIAAGEVVERPASVVKELVENSIDAGATNIVVDIEKGGAKRIKITDNGCGIAKDELTLALSRHATSKIKNLDDLESIVSLGFRGEALASISSVARLTLTSMPDEQDSAWQAIAVGRDMTVDVKPAAHPKGTTIDVEDLFFNTPARRKFLRTEKTEFTHIDEVVRRIALSQLDKSITLSHNGKVIRQYRSAKTEKQIEKRIASICGQSFIDNAVPLEFKHDNLELWGWIAKPSFYRSNNDLAYSYVNGRMMRDKLINHAIRQAYGERMGHDGYPAFVLYLNLDFSEVDVNVHPAKHEVRFHQARLVHDFICSAIEQTLNNDWQENQYSNDAEVYIDQQTGAVEAPSRDYIQPLKSVENSSGYNQPNTYASSRNSNHIASNHYSATAKPSGQAVENYQSLMTPIVVDEQQIASGHKPAATDGSHTQNTTMVCEGIALLTMVADTTALIEQNGQLYCLALSPLLKQQLIAQLAQSFTKGIVSQPLLLPISLAITKDVADFIKSHLDEFFYAGIQLELKSNNQCVIKQYPAPLREQDVQASFNKLLELLMASEQVTEQGWISAFAALKLPKVVDMVAAQQLFVNVKTMQNIDLSDYVRLNSIEVDLTSVINKLDK